MTRLCETCGHYYDDEFCWTICPHGPLWASSSAYCREHDLVNCKLHEAQSNEIEGRYFFYNFDFVRFRRSAQEAIRPVNPFILHGVCWKFKFHGGIKVSVNGALIVDLITKEHADACPLLVPYAVKIEDEICIQVADYQRRRFRWFRPNTAHVTIEVLEQPMKIQLRGEMQKFSQ